MVKDGMLAGIAQLAKARQNDPEIVAGVQQARTIQAKVAFALAALHVAQITIVLDVVDQVLVVARFAPVLQTHTNPLVAQE